MKRIRKLAQTWDIENSEKNLFATGSERNKFREVCNSIEILSDYKFKSFQPILSPPKPDFIDRLMIWLEQFEKSDQKYMLFFSSKILFFTQKQFESLMRYIWTNKIKKIILEDIIAEKNLKPFSYKKAEKYFPHELEKTLIVGLTDSSRINDFTHINSEDINRKINTGIDLSVLLYPYEKDQNGDIPIGTKNINKQFENHVLLKDKVIKNKERLIILEDFSGTGLDIIEKLNVLNSSNLPFNKIIFSPYIITYKAIEKLDFWIRNNNQNREYSYTYGSLIPKESQCFDYYKSYLKNGWGNDSDICDNVKRICDLIYGNYFPKDDEYHYGFGKIKIAFVHYYNCPDNSLPVLWCSEGGWEPLFKRASRII